MITLNDNSKCLLCDGLVYCGVLALSVGGYLTLKLTKYLHKENANKIERNFHISNLGHDINRDSIKELDKRVNNLENEIKALKESKESKENSNK